MEGLTEKYQGFEIILTAEEEETHPSDTICFETPEEEQAYLNKINHGEIGWFCAKVAACHNGFELGVSYLGCCDYSSLESFKDDSGYYEDMRDEAIKEAREKLADLVKFAMEPRPEIE